MDKETKQRVFETVFFHDVESWFDRDIACCDSCYGDFLSRWPYAYSADDARFQCDSIPLSAFYDGSKHLQDMFTEEEFYEFLPSVKCPNCGESLRSWIWPYELPFTPPEGYELLIKEIADVANKTPFLLLTHPFSLKILKAIRGCKKVCVNGHSGVNQLTLRSQRDQEQRPRRRHRQPAQNLQDP